jgi:hypothetical protein
MKKTAILEVKINLETDVLLTFDSFIEISIDCFICKRNHRTIGIKFGEDNAKCFKENHTYPAKIIEMKLSENKAEYYIEYDYNEFEDKRYKIPSDGLIKWARVHFKIICSNCKKEIDCSTQNNLSRPWSCFCKCGQLLYTEKEEMPIIKNNR